jgi:hypothetical protein
VSAIAAPVNRRETKRARMMLVMRLVSNESIPEFLCSETNTIT